MATEEDGGQGSGSRSRARGGRRGARARGRSLPTATTPSSVGLSEPPASSRWTRIGAPKERQKTRAAAKSRAAEDASKTNELDAATLASASAASKQRKKKKKGAAEDASKTSELDAATLASASAASKQRKKKKKGSKKRKRVMAAGEGEEHSPRSKRRIMSVQEAEPEAAASAATEEASDASSTVSSPLRRPYIKTPLTLEGEETLESLSNVDPAILQKAYKEHEAKYYAKERNQLRLVTLEHVRNSCLGNSWYGGPTRDSTAKTVRKTAKVVLGLSSYIDGKLLKRASGYIIEWDKESKVATVLTSALLICTKPPSLDEWLAKEEFAPHAKVYAHLLDKNDTTTTAERFYYDKHYTFALFKVKMDLVCQIPSFSNEIKYGQEIFVLGRDENQYLMVKNGRVLHKGPGSLNRHHNMFTSCHLNECCLGGPVIDLNGQFLGMLSHPRTKFIPSVIILKCLRMLKKFNCIPRLHTGMKFSAISLLDPVHGEKITRKCNVDDGLIVTGVSEGSIAEKVGIRNGDVVEFWNGDIVSTTLELENNLLRMCEEHLDNGNDIDSDVEISVGIYHVRKDSRRTVVLTLKVSDDVEVVAAGEYEVSAPTSPMVSPDDRVSD